MQWVEVLAAIAGNEQLLQFADNPKVSTQQVFDAIAGVCEKQQQALPEIGRNFLLTVIENGRVAVLPKSPASSARSSTHNWALRTPWCTALTRSTALPWPTWPASLKAFRPQAQPAGRAAARAHRRCSRGRG